ncbi:ATP-binding cassette sub-family C member 2-like [Physella acuta]|uniref:ATP-binding cassette sub-family C member 2-like n=1 Tax=Physella acuta TaxID=109671 RepID=UPI0027DBAB9C|nr:ATP-binding cassette sub-family C member 2-like [Physella acuta]
MFMLMFYIGTIVLEKSRNVVRSFPMFVYWSLASFCLLVKIFEKGMTGEYANETFNFSVVVLRYVATTVLFVVTCFAEYHGVKDKVSTTLMRLGYKRPIQDDDAYHLTPNDTSAKVTDALIKNSIITAHSSTRRKWLRLRPWECIRAKPSCDEQETQLLDANNCEDTERRSYDAVKSYASNETNKPKQRSFFMALFLTFRWDFLYCNIGMLVYVAMNLFSPIILGWLIDYSVNTTEPHWHGYVLMMLLLASKILTTVFSQSSEYLSNRLAIRVRSAAIGAIFRKSIRLSNESRKIFGLGEISNLMSVDTNHIELCINGAFWIWMSILLFLFGCFFLYTVIGLAMLSGLGLICLMLIINLVITQKMRNYHEEMMGVKDVRLNTMSEILQGIKVIKLYGWEPMFISKIMSIREKELKVLQKHSMCDWIDTFAYTGATFWITFLMLVTYVTFNEHHLVSARIAFVAINYINLIKKVITNCSLHIKYAVKMAGSIVRINKFLQAADSDSSEYNTLDDFAIRINDASFSWEKSGNNVLRNINLKIEPGKLVAVVGSVGAGKSSLLLALLGEMNRTSGSSNINSSLAYVPQQAWIQNTTVRENITFGQEFDPTFYTTIIAACALNQDLEILPAADLTEIGEKGVNLSGGQKQRISLARAVYSQADIYLFDDPLGAVDSHVGQHIFQNVISNTGLLKKKTRVLVTHGIHLLSDVDLVVIMHDGKIVDSGGPEILHLGNKCFKKIIHLISDSTSTDNESDWDKSGKLVIVKWEVYLDIIKGYGVPYVLLTAVLICGFHVAYNAAYITLTMWIGDNHLFNNTELPDQSLERNDLNRHYILYYLIWGSIQTLCVLIYSGLFQFRHVTTCRWIHAKLINSVLRAPMSFFDTTPMGRILNRFSQDLDILDSAIFINLEIFLEHVMFALGILGIISYVFPGFLGVLFVAVFLFIIVQQYYIKTSCQLKRIASKNRSPVFAHFSETLSGLTVIRAHRQQLRFTQDSHVKVDFFQRPMMIMYATNKWMQTRLDIITYILIAGVTLFTISNRGEVEPGLVSLSITFILRITNDMTLVTRMSSELESNIISVERIQEYSQIKNEAPWTLPDDSRLSGVWPLNGNIEFVNYSARYREGLDFVLRNINVSINAGEKIGIVGRTGAGKSSMVLALFRLIEVASGYIVIDGVDISKIGLHTLRHAVTILPQDPVLFAGSLRMNLDPSKEKSDIELWDSLEHANLKDFVQQLPNQLEYDVGEGGENLSVGQKQLICLARTLLRKTKILVFDEATASVDIETDDFIQKTIRTAFRDCTVITIAHRIHTVMDYDRIIVLEQGKIIEVDGPSNLLQNSTSKFYSLLARNASLENKMAVRFKNYLRLKSLMRYLTYIFKDTSAHYFY